MIDSGNNPRNNPQVHDQLLGHLLQGDLLQGGSQQGESAGGQRPQAEGSEVPEEGSMKGQGSPRKAPKRRGLSLNKLTPKISFGGWKGNPKGNPVERIEGLAREANVNAGKVFWEFLTGSALDFVSVFDRFGVTVGRFAILTATVPPLFLWAGLRNISFGQLYPGVLLMAEKSRNFQRAVGVLTLLAWNAYVNGRLPDLRAILTQSSNQLHVNLLQAQQVLEAMLTGGGL
jgi:hypothetical protein